MHCTVSDTVSICICLMAPVLIFLEGSLTNNSKEERFVLGHNFLKLQSMVPGLMCWGSTPRQQEILHLMRLGSRKEVGRG